MISVLTLVAVTSTVGIISGQAPPPAEGRRLEIRVTPLAPIPPQPRDGDAIRTGPEGEVVIEWRDASDKMTQRQIPRRNRVSPEIATETKLTDEEKVSYSYTVTNGPAARQDIVHFALGARRPDMMTKSSPPANWRSLGSSPDFPRWHWCSDFRANDIKPGQSAGPFRYESPLLPGLMDAYFEGYLSSEEEAIDPHAWRLSLWLVESLHDALRFENNSVRVQIVGPKIEVSPALTRTWLAELIAGEMTAASQMPEFEEYRAFLEDTSAILKSLHRVAGGMRERLVEMGGTALQRSFFRAMTLNLEYLEKL